MLKNIAIYILIIALTAVLYISSSRTTMEYLSAKRTNAPAWWGTHPDTTGDLVNISYLDFVDYFKVVHYPLHKSEDTAIKNVALYIHGDSYTRDIPASYYSFLASYGFSFRGYEFRYRLNPTRKNVLILETTERFVRETFNSLNLLNEISAAPQPEAGSPPAADYKTTIVNVSEPAANTSLFNGIRDLFNPYINQNLQFNLFNYNFIMPLFQSKAALNYHLFSRASGDVVIADNNKLLLIKESMQPYGIRSAYNPVSERTIDTLINNLNQLYDHYKADGFDEIRLCIIPNPVTILQAGPYYNNLLQRVQYDPRLKMNIIDIYSDFKNTGMKYFQPGDTHWNELGVQVWLNKVNKMLDSVRNRE